LLSLIPSLTFNTDTCVIYIVMAPNAVHVMITGAAGQIGYALAPMVARGAMLGPDQPVVLHLLDIEPAAQALQGVKMELLDAAFPLLHGMLSTNRYSFDSAGWHPHAWQACRLGCLVVMSVSLGPYSNAAVLSCVQQV
jgi:hypothetical protein